MAANCANGTLAPGDGSADLVITKTCVVPAGGTYKYKNVDIYQDGSSKGWLRFDDGADTNFWAASILIENGGKMTAGVNADGTTITPFGTANNGTLIVHLYGDNLGNHGQGVRCHDQTCGVDSTIFNANKMDMAMPNPRACVVNNNLPGGVSDCFYKYGPLQYDDGGNLQGYFGYKVIGVGYGGTLQLYGKKGAVYPDTNVVSSDTGVSWGRLDNCPTGMEAGCSSGVLQKGAKTLKVALNPSTGTLNWKKGDWVVVTTTDYLPHHSELRQLDEDADSSTNTIKLTTALSFPHNASVFDVKGRISKTSRTGLTDLAAVDTRAAVGLLTRSIRIVSGGKTCCTNFPDASTDVNTPSFTFGGQVIFRQGFQKVQMQGVEVYQMGQGGKIAHYPIHFHMCRRVPADTFIKDSSVWDSMTRWIVVHATQGVLLARNVGYRSIGHGYYLEDATETGNRLFANLGVSALAAVNLNDKSGKPQLDASNVRQVPGILAYYNPSDIDTARDTLAFSSDAKHPTIFWITNGWNKFDYNMAAGAETCGACYWFVPAGISAFSRYMNWTGYASEQFTATGREATTPLQEFVGNTCSTAMTSFIDTGEHAYCNGVDGPDNPTDKVHYNTVKNTLLEKPQSNFQIEKYYPRIVEGGNHNTTVCPDGDSTTKACNDFATPPFTKYCGKGSDEIVNCGVIAIDHYISSFNYNEKNYSAIWMRPKWSLMNNSALTDLQGGGLTFVTGGGYTRSDASPGIWQLSRKSVFVGHTQPFDANAYGADGGPINPNSGVTCLNSLTKGAFCLPVETEGGKVVDEGNLLLPADFQMNQRFLNIYDGPNFEESNSFFDIIPTDISKTCDLTSAESERCKNSTWFVGTALGVPGNFVAEGAKPSGCYLPNAAIAWKQSNGFYYPPAFHSLNLFFDNVPIRHYVIEPRFVTGTLDTDFGSSKSHFCNARDKMWQSFTDIDRQTELTDDDGSLTGLTRAVPMPTATPTAETIETISVNQDDFFRAPTEDGECKSDVKCNPTDTNKQCSAKTSPYEYVSTVIWPDGCNGVTDPNAKNCIGIKWGRDCGSQSCYGVPMYRLLLNPGEKKSPFIRLMGEGNGQRSTLTPNNGSYYIDTTVPENTQLATANNLNVFQGGKKYHLFLLFARKTSKENFQFFVGTGLKKEDVLASITAETGVIPSNDITFTPLSPDPFSTGNWKKDYNPGPNTDANGLPAGMVKVSLDMNFSTFINAVSDSIEGRCKPKAMCSWNTDDNACECNITDPNSPFFKECQADKTAFCKWATKDIDWPDKGAFGFSFTMPSDPTTKVVAVPPPSCFPQDANWNVSFSANPPGSPLAGDCEYTSTPPSPAFCTNVGQAALEY